MFGVVKRALATHLKTDHELDGTLSSAIAALVTRLGNAELIALQTDRSARSESYTTIEHIKRFGCYHCTSDADSPITGRRLVGLGPLRVATIGPMKIRTRLAAAPETKDTNAGQFRGRARAPLHTRRHWQ